MKYPNKKFYGTLLFALAAILLQIACPKDIRLPVKKVMVDLYPNVKDAGFSLNRAEIHALVKDAVQKIPDLHFVDSKKDGAVLRVRVGLSDDANDDNKIALSLKLSAGKNKSYFGASPLLLEKDANQSIVFSKALSESLNRLLDDHRGVQQSTQGMIDRLKNYMRLGGSGKTQAMQALQVLGDRKELRASTTIQALLKSRDEEVIRKALWALSQIGDHDSIDAISAYAERKPKDVRLSTIAVARAIGGHKAAAWLFTLSSGHPDGDVQDAAENAFRSIESKLSKTTQKQMQETEWERKRKGS